MAMEVAVTPSYEVSYPSKDISASENGNAERSLACRQLSFSKQ
nr:MAG TPA: hypothetical protein [Caudoviricetes sp.]